MNIRICKIPASATFPTAPGASVPARATLNPPSINSQEIPMFENIRKVVTPALLALIAGIAALTPICGHADEAPRSIRVSLAGLNANSVEGARKIYVRINDAAWAVCGESSMDMDVMIRGPSECVKEALAHAVRDVHSVELAKVYIKKNGIKVAKQYNVTTDVLMASK